MTSLDRWNLLDIQLPAGVVNGIAVEPGGWTGLGATYLNRKATGTPIPGVVEIDWSAYDGIRFVGDPMMGTTIDGGPTSNGSVMIGAGTPGGPTTGIVEFSGVTIKVGGSKAIYAGTDQMGRVPMIPMGLILTDFVIDGRDRRGRWGIFPDCCDLVMRRGSVLCDGITEHGEYDHGVAAHGMLIESVRFDGAAAELFKVTSRPNDQGGPYADGSWYEDPAKRAIALSRHAHAGTQPVGTPDKRPTIRVRDCTFTRWGLLSGKSGAIVSQGSGADWRIERCTFYANNGNIGGGGVFVDDSLVEHWGRSKADPSQWAAGGAPANGDVLISECAFYSDDGPTWLSPMIFVGRLGVNNSEDVCESFSMLNCAVYGRNRTVQISGVPKVKIAGINSPAIEFWAQGQGIDTRPWQVPGQSLGGVLLHVRGRGLEQITTDFEGSAP